MPDNMREKLATMDAGVKAAFVKSSKDLAIMSSKPTEPPMTPRGLRKARSIESISSPQPLERTTQSRYNLSKAPERPRFMNTHNRGVSVDADHQILASHEKPAPVSKPAKEKRSKKEKRKVDVDAEVGDGMQDNEKEDRKRKKKQKKEAEAETEVDTKKKKRKDKEKPSSSDQ